MENTFSKKENNFYNPRKLINIPTDLLAKIAKKKLTPNSKKVAEIGIWL